MAIKRPQDSLPTKVELDVISELLPALKQKGEFQVRFMERLPDEYSTLLVSVKVPPEVQRSSPEMLAVHELAQSVSDKFDHNVVVTTTAAGEGGQRISFDLENLHEIVKWEVLPGAPNYYHTARLQIASLNALAEKKSIMDPFEIPNAMCDLAESYIRTGFVDEAKKILDGVEEISEVLSAKDDSPVSHYENYQLALHLIYMNAAIGNFEKANQLTDKVFDELKDYLATQNIQPLEGEQAKFKVQLEGFGFSKEMVDGADVSTHPFQNPDGTVFDVEAERARLKANVQAHVQTREIIASETNTLLDKISMWFGK